jgi:hypothetical protein
MSYQLQRNDDAELHFRAAIRLGSRSYVGRYFLGQRALRDAFRFSFGPPDPSKSARLFMECLELNPRFTPAAEALAAIVGLLPQRWAEAEALVRAEAARHPANLKIQAGIAMLEARTPGRVWRRTRWIASAPAAMRSIRTSASSSTKPPAASRIASGAWRKTAPAC